MESLSGSPRPCLLSSHPPGVKFPPLRIWPLCLNSRPQIPQLSGSGVVLLFMQFQVVCSAHPSSGGSLCSPVPFCSGLLWMGPGVWWGMTLFFKWVALVWEARTKKRLIMRIGDEDVLLLVTEFGRNYPRLLTETIVDFTTGDVENWHPSPDRKGPPYETSYLLIPFSHAEIFPDLIFPIWAKRRKSRWF